MDIYLDTNATTPVLPCARSAALAAMADDFGNPSSIHSTGLRARALMDAVRARARRLLGAPTGQLLFLSGATEGIQTAVLSALRSLRGRQDVDCLLYGATEHKAVPEAIRHWNELLGLNLHVLAIPVGPDGRHDLPWLRAHAGRAGLVCTMAANNETGVVSDLDGIAQALDASPALWMVDSVQALGKLALQLETQRIDYAPFSGHKLYAPKGIGLLYVREGAPFTPLMAGGGQEGALRSGTENMSGIAALGAVLEALEDGHTFRDAQTLAGYRDRIASALKRAFPGIVFNAPFAACLPTTLNFSVPGLSSRLLQDLFDAADVRVSGGSACSASKATPSHVLEAMKLPAWQAASAVRLSFGPANDADFIDEACERIEACGASLRASCLNTPADAMPSGDVLDGLKRFVVNGACCYLLADAGSRRCVVIDPLPGSTERIAQLLRCQDYAMAAVLQTHGHGDHVASGAELRAALPERLRPSGEVDALGWPVDADAIRLGAQTMTRRPIPGHAMDATAYLLHDARMNIRLAFVGDTLMPDACERSDLAQAAPLAPNSSVQAPRALLLPAHDHDNRFASTLAAQPMLAQVLLGRMSAEGLAAAKAELERDLTLTEYQSLTSKTPLDSGDDGLGHEMTAIEARRLLREHPDLVLVDVREPYEQRLSEAPPLGAAARRKGVPLSELLDALPAWLALPATTPVLFYCRSGNRSAQAAKVLRRLGHAQAWSLTGGLALWPAASAAAKSNAPATAMATATEHLAHSS